MNIRFLQKYVDEIKVMKQKESVNMKINSKIYNVK